jgi:hypothetical protein
MPWSCPICGQHVVVEYEDHEGGNLLERSDYCLMGCYQSDYSYGNSRERIGERAWEWSYEETRAETILRLNQRQEVIYRTRRDRALAISVWEAGNLHQQSVNFSDIHDWRKNGF